MGSLEAPLSSGDSRGADGGYVFNLTPLLSVQMIQILHVWSLTKIQLVF